MGILTGTSGTYYVMSNYAMSNSGFTPPNIYFDAVPSTATFTIRYDGTYFYAVRYDARCLHADTELVTTLNNVISDTPTGGSIVIQENDAIFTLANYVNLNKDINFYSHAKLKVADSFPTYRVFDIQASDVDIFIYSLDGNKAGNPSQNFAGLEISGSENLKIKVHTKNFGYEDVCFKGSASEPNKNIQLQIHSENIGGVGLNSGVYLGQYNSDITISGRYYNISGNGGQVIYNTATLGAVTVRDFKVQDQNNTGTGKPVIDCRANTITYISNVEINVTTNNQAIITLATSEVYVNNLRISNIGTSQSKAAIENYGVFIGSNIKVDMAYMAVYTRGGSDWASVSGFDFRNTETYTIYVNSDSGGNHTFGNGKIVGTYGISDGATSEKKSSFTNIDLTGVTTSWAKGNGAYLINCPGAKSQNSGKTQAKDGDSISHGLFDTPTAVVAVADTSDIFVSVVAIHTTTFVIDMRWSNGTEVTTYHAIYWFAERRP